MEQKLINGFSITMDKTPPKWTGSVYVKSPFKAHGHYFTSHKDSIIEAIAEAFERYGSVGIKGLSLTDETTKEEYTFGED